MQKTIGKTLTVMMFALLALNLHATLPTDVNSWKYQGNDKTTKFDFKAKIVQAKDLKVKTIDPEGNEKTLKLNVDYTVTGVDNASGGYITYPINGTPLKSGWYIFLHRVVDLKQMTDFISEDGYFPESHEDAFDYEMMIAQQQQGELDAAIKVPIDEKDNNLTIPRVFQRINKLLGFDEKGNPIAVTQKAFIYRGDYTKGATYSVNDIIRDPDQSHIYIALKTFIASTISEDLEKGNIDFFLINYSGNAIWIDGIRVILSGIENGDSITYENGNLVPRSSGGTVKTWNNVAPDAHGNINATTDNLPEGEMESRKYLTQNNCNALGVVRVEDPEKGLTHGFVVRASMDGQKVEDAYPIQQDDEECLVHTVKILGQNQTIFPSRYLPHLNIGRMWVQKVGEYDKEQRWWYQLAHREDFQSDAESGDLCYAIDEGLHDWELHQDPIHGGIQISHEYYHNDPWSIQYIDHHNETYALAKAEVSSGKHVIKGRHARGGYWLYIAKDYAGQGIFEVNIKVHYDNIAEVQNIPIYSAELADIKKNTWLYQEIETPEPLQHYNQIDAIEIKANVVTRGHESSGNIFLDDITVEFNIAANETDEPIWSKNYCPAIAPAHKWDIFACQDIDRAKHPSHENPKDDGWLDYEIPIGIQYINGHTGLTVELETGDIDEGLGSHGKIHKWLNDSNLKSIAAFIDLTDKVIVNSDKIKEIIINIADMATKTWVNSQNFLKKGTDLENYIANNAQVQANKSKAAANEIKSKANETAIGKIKSLKPGDYRVSSRSAATCAPNEIPCNMGLMLLDANKYPELSEYCEVIDGKFVAAITVGDHIRNVGGNAAALNKHQDDAIRDITGSFWFYDYGASTVLRDANGVFKPIDTLAQGWDRGSSSKKESHSGVEFRTSNQVPTANENRPVGTTKNFFEIVASSLTKGQLELVELYKDKTLPTIYWADEKTGEYTEYNTISPINYFETTKDKIVYWYEKSLLKNLLTTKPLESKKGFAVVRKGKLNEWEYAEDHRGKIVYEKATGNTVKVDYIGKIKEEYTSVKPPQYIQFYKFDNGKWILDNSKQLELVKYIASIIRGNTEQYLRDRQWQFEANPEPIPPLTFESISNALSYIKTLKDKSMEELIKILDSDVKMTKMTKPFLDTINIFAEAA